MEFDNRSNLLQQNRLKTRLISIESQPKKIVVGVVVVIGVVVGVGVHVVVVVIPVDDPRNILKVWLNQVINR